MDVSAKDTSQLGNSNRQWLDYDLIKKSNDLIKTITLKQKEYAPVNERVMAFRRVHPLGQIITNASFTDNYAMFEAEVVDENGVLLARGHAREFLKNEFALEKAETSSVGRALGLAGYGCATSLSSFEDMQEVDKPSEIFDEPSASELAEKLKGILTQQEKVDFLNCVHKVELKSVPSYMLMAMLRLKEDEKHNSGK